MDFGAETTPSMPGTPQFFAYLHARPDTADVSGVFYVGKGTLARSKELVSNRRGVHHQNVVRKYGKENILIGRIACTTEQTALDLEVGIIKCLARMGVALTNKTAGGEGLYNPPKEIREKISASVRRYLADPEVKAKLSAARRGRVASDDTRQKMSAAQRTRVRTPEEIQKRKDDLSRRKISEDTRERLSAASKLKFATPGSRERLSKALTGKKRSSDVKAAKSAAMRAYSASPDVRKRLSEQAKAAWAKRKAGAN